MEGEVTNARPTPLVRFFPHDLVRVHPLTRGVTVKIKPGRYVLDPMNRRVYVLSVDGDTVKVRLGGSYGATVDYPRSCLRPDPEEER